MCPVEAQALVSRLWVRKRKSGTAFGESVVCSLKNILNDGSSIMPDLSRKVSCRRYNMPSRSPSLGVLTVGPDKEKRSAPRGVPIPGQT